MRKTTLFCALLFATLTPIANAQECKVLRVGGTANWLSVAYVDAETKEPLGIGHDLARVIGEKLNIPVELDALIPWKRMLLYLKQGKLDMTAAIFFTQQRAAEYQYTKSYFANTSLVYVLKGKEFAFDKFEDLVGLVGGSSVGSIGDEFDTFAIEHKLRLEKVRSVEQLTKKLLAGRNDYFISDTLMVSQHLKQNGLEDKIVSLPHPVSKTSVFFALSRKSPCLALLPKIDAVIAQTKQDGTLQKIVDKYVN